MRRRTKVNINPKHLLIGCGLFCFLMIFISFQFKEQVAPVKTAVGSVITPMQKGINSVGHAISDEFEKLASMSALIKENTNLKKQVDSLTYENKILMQDKYELDRFRDLYKLDQKYADYPKVAASVISQDPSSSYYNIFLIDKGTEDGIKVNMNVIAGNGLVGIVEEVNKNYSKVRSIVDDSSYVYATILKTSDSCIVHGDLELLENGVIKVTNINKDAEIEDGYEIVTSNSSEKYLQGILIGYISDINVDSSNMTKTAYLTPAANFSRLDEVLIITQVKEKLE